LTHPTDQLAEAFKIMLCIFIPQGWQESLESLFSQLLVSQVEGPIRRPERGGENESR
jgi:hypothetical protein